MQDMLARVLQPKYDLTYILDDHYVTEETEHMT